MVRIGIAGLGFMGVTHFHALSLVDDAQVVALVSSSARKLSGDWRDVKGNFGGPGGVVDTSGMHHHAELELLLNDPDVDMVDLCIPTPLHAEWAVRVMEAGKDVLVEKPIALSVGDADKVVAAVAKTGQHCFVGHVLRFFPAFRWLCDVVQEERYGVVAAVNLLRMTSGEWWVDQEKGSSPALDLHIHDSDLIRHLWGMPQKVSSTGYTSNGRNFRYITTQYCYDENSHPVITATASGLASPPLSFSHGFELQCESATLVFDSRHVPHGAIYHRDNDEILKPDIDTSDTTPPFADQWRAVLEVVTGVRQECGLEARYARDSLSLCLSEIESAHLGFPVDI